MKTLFFIAALAGGVFLIMQTPAGKAWLENGEPSVDFSQPTQHKMQPLEQVRSQVSGSLENKVTELTQRLNQKQQAQIDQLESRIAELENELIMERIAKKQQPQTRSSGSVTLHPYQQSQAPSVAPTSTQGLVKITSAPDTLVASAEKQLQRNRQARLQDIAEKMEMSSLQALVN